MGQPQEEGMDVVGGRRSAWLERGDFYKRSVNRKTSTAPSYLKLAFVMVVERESSSVERESERMDLKCVPDL